MKNLQNLCRRSLSLLLALVMCISVMQIPAFAADDASSGSTGSESSSSGTPSNNSSSNDTSSSSASGGSSGGSESGAPAGSSNNTGSTTTTSPANSGSGDSTGDSHETSAGTGGDASNNGGSDDTSSGDSESKTETADSNESSSNNTDTTEPAGSNDDQTTGAPASAPTNDGSGTPANEGDTQKNEPAQNTGAAEFIPVTPTDLVTGDQEKNDTENDAWDQVVDNLSTSKGPMMAAAPAQQDKTAQDDTKTETTTVPLPLPEDGVEVTVEPNETEKVDIPSDVTIPDGVKPAENGTITWTTTTKPDNVPENATKNADGSWTWTEKKDQDPGLTGFTAVGDPSVIMEPTEDGMIRETITQEYKNENGDTYTKVTQIIKEPGQNTTGKEPDKTETAITITTTTTEKTETTTVKPGTVEVTMNPVDRDNTNISKEDFDVTGATVTIKNGSDGTYNADVQIGLSGSLKPDGTVTVTVKGPDGTVYKTTLSEVDENGNYTLSGINLGGLTEDQEKQISVTITGQQIKEIVTPGNGSTAPDNMTPETQPGKVVTIGYDSESGKVTQITATEQNKIQGVHDFLGTLEVTNDFAIYADKYGNSNCGHIDGNICVNDVEHYTTITIKGSQYGPQGSNKQEISTNYAVNGFSYVRDVEGEKKIQMSSEVNSNHFVDGKLTDVATLVVGSQDITVDNQGANSFDVVYLENGKLKEEDLTAHPELENLQDAMKITENLSAIAAEGQDLIGDAGNGGSDGDKAKLLAAIDYLKNQEVTSSDVISLTLSIDTLTNPPSGDDWNTFKDEKEEARGCISELIAANTAGATIIINVDMEGKDKKTNVTIKPNFGNWVGDYDGNAANLIWNFGDHEGNITFDCHTAGRVVAPKALLHLNAGIQAGNAVAQTVTHGGEIHMAVPSDKHDWPKPDKPQTETQTVTTNLTVSLTVKVDGGEKIITTQGGSNTVKIESVTTNTYEKPNVPTPPPDDDPGGDIPGPGPGPGSNPNPKPDPKPEPEPEPEPPVEIEDPDVPLTPTPEPEPDFPDDPDANTPNVPDVPDVDIPDDDVPLAPKPNLPDYPTVSIPDNDVPMASVPSTDDGLVEIEEEEIPLADVPQTGDTFGSWALLAALSLCGVTALALPGKRKER